MRLIAPLALALLAGCANVEDYRRQCEASADRALFYSRGRFTEEQLARNRERQVSLCMEHEAANERGRQAAPILAIVFGAGSAALAEHNFYVYEVPRARRYLGR